VVSATPAPSAPAPGAGDVRIAVIGAGFGGIGTAIRLRQRGIADFLLFERAADLGGTWRDNTYPGCACDVESHLYALSFAPWAGWTRKFAGQEEIWAYLRRTADAFGVTPHIRYRHEVTSAAWDDGQARWTIETSAGTYRASVLVLATGPLSEPVVPDLPGLDRFPGAAFHSARWRHDVDLRRLRVAVVGTGASAAQFIPQIQPHVERLHVFQRTPAWVTPRRDRAIPAWRRALYRRVPAAQRATRAARDIQHELIGLPFRHPWLAPPFEAIARRHLVSAISDAGLRRTLTPTYRMGCKRVLISDDFYPALAKPNVEVIAASVVAIDGSVAVGADGTRRDVDAIVFGTGFRPTDPVLAPHVRGRDGLSLAERWCGSPKAYMGTTVAGFPNLFILVGPNTGLGHSSEVLMIEAQIEHLLGVLALMERHGAASVEPVAEAEDAYVREMDDRLRGTVWNSGGCRSWYLDRTGRNASIWPGGTWSFRRRLARVIPGHYRLGAP
jgi:cation diffusion facilitator CzcD-associated flavoprotein CzcO